MCTVSTKENKTICLLSTMHPSADADETFQTLTSRQLVLPQKQCWQKQKNNVQQKQKF